MAVGRACEHASDSSSETNHKAELSCGKHLAPPSEVDAQYPTDMGLRYPIGDNSPDSRGPANSGEICRRSEEYCLHRDILTPPADVCAHPIKQQGADAQPSPCTLRRSLASRAPFSP